MGGSFGTLRPTSRKRFLGVRSGAIWSDSKSSRPSGPRARYGHRRPLGTRLGAIAAHAAAFFNSRLPPAPRVRRYFTSWMWMLFSGYIIVLYGAPRAPSSK